MAKKQLDPKKTHWTESPSTDDLQGVRSFRPMTDDEVERYNQSKTGQTKVQPATVKSPDIQRAT